MSEARRQRGNRWRLPGLHRLGLRARATIGFGVTGLVVALIVAFTTYGVTRAYLVAERSDAAKRQAYVNARLARAVLRSPDPDVRRLLVSLGGDAASTSVIRYRGETFSTSVTQGPDAVPADLERVVGDGHAGHQRLRDADGNLLLAVGVPMEAVDGAYFEVFALADLERTLSLLARALAIGVVGAAVVGAVVGRIAADRVVRPLAPVASAAERIAGGALDTRLTDIDDPDLTKLTDAFNTMAAALEVRIEREARFAADVSHELRSPLTAINAALEIIGRRRQQLPAEVIEPFDVLVDKVRTFQQTVLDLLEISQLDAGTADVSADLIDLHHFLPRVLARHGADAVPVTFEEGAADRVTGDRRRLAQAVGNIVDNARHYAGGTTAVRVVAGEPGTVRIELDDRGPGVSPEERLAIFGRFARGEVGRESGATSGSGLGLSLVTEHLRLHQGQVWVEDNPGGGARFVIELPEGDHP